MRREIARIHRAAGATTLYVTHDQVEALTLADRLAVMRDGRLVQVGTPREVYDLPRSLFVARFLGSPPMNLMTARIHGTRLTSPLGTFPIEGPAASGPAREASLGIRPEHVALADAGASGLSARVDDVEWTGSEAHVTVRLEGASEADAIALIVRAPGGTLPDRGTFVGLRPDPSRVHLFDARSGRRLEAAVRA
jgi:multiple sugar transport system ATP-binding protein